MCSWPRITAAGPATSRSWPPGPRWSPSLGRRSLSPVRARRAGLCGLPTLTPRAMLTSWEPGRMGPSRYTAAPASSRWKPSRQAGTTAWVPGMRNDVLPPGSRVHELVLGMAHRQHRTGRLAHDLLRDAAEQHVGQPAMPVRAHHDQVDVGFPGVAHDLVERSAFAHLPVENEALELVLF